MNYHQNRHNMRTETRNNGIRDYTVLIADDGKILKRIEDGFEVGNEMSLGYSYYHFVDGVNVKRESPLLERPEHYEEIDAPVEEDIDNTEVIDGNNENL